MGRELDSALRRAAATTFEQLGFLFADGEPDDEQAGAPWGGAAAVEFTGPARGRLEVRVTGDVMPELAANMLGLVPPLARTIQVDALGEVTNVICGNVLPALAGRDAVFDLGAPRPLDAHAAPGSAAEAEVLLGLGAGRALVSLHLEAWSAGGTR
jgi:hypothetical protein